MEEEKLYKEFQTLLNGKKYKEALVLIDKLILINQSKAEYFNNKGVCLHNIGGRDREKLECYDKAVSLDDKNTTFITNKGAALVNLREEYDEAHRVLDLSLKLNDKYSNTYYWKGMAFYRQSLYFRSLEYMDKCLSLNPKYSDAHYYKGLSLREMNCFEDSVKEFDLVIKFNPNDAYNYYQKALTLMEMEEYDKAITELNKAINFDPNDVDFLNNKATCLIKLNKLEEALIETEQILNNDQYDSEALKNKAQIYLNQNKPKEALLLIDRGFKGTPEFYELKGLILHKLSKEDEAIYCFLEAIRLKDQTQKTLIENMSSIIDNYKNRIPKSELQNLKELNDNCVKLLTEIKKIDSITVNQQSFSPVNLPVDWKKIPFNRNNISNYLKVHERFICQICLSLVKSPKSCQSCEYIFCSEYLVEALAIKDSCPNCRANPFKESKINLIVKEIYDSIETQCPLKCGENFVMENLEKHLSLCEKREKYYECKLCKENLKSEEEVEDHKQKCPEIMLQCLMCNENFKNPHSGNHIDSCFERVAECEKCLSVIPFKYEGSHRDYFCDLLKFLVEGAQKIQKKLIELEIF